MNDLPLDVVEVRKGLGFVFGGVYAANDGFYAEIHEQTPDAVRRVATSDAMPSRECALAWMTQEIEQKRSAA